MRNRLVIILGVLAAIIAGTVFGHLRDTAPEAPFWAKIRNGAGVAEGEYLYDSVADLTPGADDSGVFKAAAALIQGTFVDIEPGIAFSTDDGESVTPVVPYDSADVAMRYASLVIRVDKVLAGRLGQGYTDGKIRLRIEHPSSVTLLELKNSLGTAGSGLIFVHNLAERQQLVGRPITDPVQLAYARNVYTSIGDGLFVEETAGSPVVAPLMDPERAAQLLGYTYVEPDEATPDPTPTCDDPDGLCYTPTGKPTASATSVPVGGTEPATPPTLATLRTTLLAAACAEGTATGPC